MNRLRIAIADGDEQLADLIGALFERDEEVELTATAKSGDDVLHINLEANYYISNPFVNSAAGSRKLWLREKEPRNLFPMHAGSQELAESQTHAYQTDESVALEREVTGLIHEIGIPANVKGYRYLREAIMMCMEDMDKLNAITKELYPSIASQQQTTPSCVERGIRHAIGIAWTKGKTETLRGLFGYTAADGRNKPTNSEFIAVIADKMRLHY